MSKIGEINIKTQNLAKGAIPFFLSGSIHRYIYIVKWSLCVNFTNFPHFYLLTS